MEHTLGDNQIAIFDLANLKVLILVLMEHTLGVYLKIPEESLKIKS